MLPISALDAISPAVQRTKAFLFRPFRLGTFLKLCMVASITEGSGGGFQGTGPVGHHSHHHSSFYAPPALTPGWIALLVAAFLVVIVLGCVVSYLIARLRFAYFHCLIHNIKEIRPGWHLYRAQAARFFWLNLVVGFCILLAVILTALPFVAGFWRLFRNLPPGGHPDLGSLLLLVLPLIPIVLLLVIAAFAANLVLHDMMMPHFALENATAGEAWKAVWPRIKAEKGPFFVYALLRILLPLAAMIGVFMVMILPAIIFLVAVVGLEVAIHVAVANASSAVALFGISLQILIGVAAFALVLLMSIGIGGLVGTAIRQYALLFYGSRYQPLGDILSPPPALSPNVPELA